MRVQETQFSFCKEEKIIELKVDRRSIGQSKHGEFQFNSFETELEQGYVIMLTDGVIDAVRTG